MTVRDRALELEVLDQAAADSKLQPGYAQRVVDRMDRVGAAHGDAWTGLELNQLLYEIEQEALDLGGWAVLTLQRLEHADVAEQLRRRGVNVADVVRELESLAALGAIAEANVRAVRATARGCRS